MWALDHKEVWVLKNWCFQTVVLKKTLESSLDCKEITPVNHKGNLECSLEGLMLKLKLQCFGHLIWRVTHWKRPWCWERLRARGERGNTGWDDWIASLIKWTWVWANSRFVMNREAWRAAVHEVTKSQTGLRDWTTTTMYGCKSWTVQKVEWQRIDVF